MSSTDSVQQLLDIAEYIFAYFGLAILAIGTLGNAINVISFARLESLKTLASSLFLLTSFLASQMVLIFGVLTRVIRGFSGVDPVYTSVLFCKIRWWIRTTSNAVSLTCVCFAAIDRYFLSCRQLHRHRWITMKRAAWAIVFTIWFWSSVFSSYAIYYTAPKPLSCTIADPFFAYFATIFNLFHYSILPLSILTIFCWLTWHNLGQQPTTYLRGGIRLYDQVTRMLIAQSIGICLTSIPNMIWQIYMVATRTILRNSVSAAQENLINTICVLVGFTTHAITFYVYLLASSTFRKNVKEMFMRTRRIIPLANPDVVKVTFTQADRRLTLSIA